MKRMIEVRCSLKEEKRPSEFVEMLDIFGVVFHEFLWYSLDRRVIPSTDFALRQSVSQSKAPYKCVARVVF